MLRLVLEPAWVLHPRPWRDSSLIVELFTAAQGRLAVVARGARRPKSRLGAVLQPFRPLMVSAAGRGELATLGEAELRAPGGRPLALQGRALISGFYMNELLMKLLTRHDPHPHLFEAYEEAVTRLADPALDATREQRALRRFELVLLGEIGYGLVLDHDVESGAPIDAGAEYEYHPERGPVAIRGVRETATRGSVSLRGRSLIDLARDELHDPVSLREVRGLMRMALALCLGGQPLRSRELFRPATRAGRVPEDIGEESR